MTEPPPPFDYRGTSLKGGYTAGQLMLATAAVLWVVLFLWVVQ